MTLIFTNSIFKQHNTGQHPENSGRLDAIEQLQLQQFAQKGLRFAEIPDPSQLVLTYVHSPEQIALVQKICLQGGGQIDADTVVSEKSFDAAVMAATTATRAVDAVLDQVDKNALCLLRPPGHHASQFISSGFCLFNNVAIAARYAQKQRGISRVLVIDWDVHHGNGTQDIFYDDDSVGFFSIHRYPFYPGTGSESETGAGKGLGSTINVPVNFGTPRSVYLQLFRQGLDRAARKIRPELILISAGFDAHELDPVGNLGLKSEDFATMTAYVQEIADVYCHGRIVSYLEGGYHLSALAQSVKHHLLQLLSLSP